MTHASKFLGETAEIIAAIDDEQIERLVDNLSQFNHTLWIVGLGGSAANASHAAADFRRLCDIDARCLTDSVASFSALANDEGWNMSFAAQLQEWATEDDALLVLSVGGGSQGVSLPIIEAVKTARGYGMKVYGIVGKNGGYTAENGDCVVKIPTVSQERVTPHTEAWQLLLVHLLVSHPKLQKRRTKW